MEAMERLGLEHNPKMLVIFRPLVVLYVRSIVSFLLLRTVYGSTYKGEEMRVLDDDLFVRLYGVALSREFLG